jgi:hypothetical protein
MKRQGNPIYTFGYAALMGSAGLEKEFGEAIDYLNRLPLWLRGMPTVNSGRNDLVHIPNARSESGQANQLLPVDERRLHKSNTNPFVLDHGEAGADENVYDRNYFYSPNIFTLPYWAARYYGFLKD